MDHHVYFWLKSEYQSPADRAAFEKGLDSLFTIDLLESGRWAVPAAVPPRPVLDSSWNYALTMQFASVEKHDIYQTHPRHLQFIEQNKHRWAKVLVMDLA